MAKDKRYFEVTGCDQCPNFIDKYDGCVPTFNTHFICSKTGIEYIDKIPDEFPKECPLTK